MYIQKTWDESQRSANEPDESRADKGCAEVECPLAKRMRDADEALH